MDLLMAWLDMPALRLALLPGLYQGFSVQALTLLAALVPLVGKSASLWQSWSLLV
jgi:hypothetical protein